MIDHEEPATMTDRPLATGGSALLARAAPADLARLAAAARRVSLGRGDVLADAGAPAPAAFFVEQGVASVTKPGDGERSTELCLVGAEGFVGTPIVVADGRWPYRAYVQTEGLTAVAVPAPALRALLDEAPDFRALLLVAVHLQTIQIAEGLVSAAWQKILARLARWLLMYRDRLHSARLEVTHESMALMIGAERAKITAALHDLESRGAIAARRGVVMIRDAALLEALADGGYGAAEREAARLLSPARAAR